MARQRKNHDDEFDFESFDLDARRAPRSPIIDYHIESGFRESNPERLLSDVPQVIEVNEFDDKSVRAFEKSMAAAMQTEQEIIPIVIDSYGGECYALFRMLDLIKVAQQRGFTVATIATGKAMSCGADLLAAGSPGFRYATPEATIMIHEISGLTFGKQSENEREVAQMAIEGARLYAHLDAACDQSPGYWEARIHENHHANLYLSPADALEAGLISGIGLPTFKICAKLEFEWIKP
jgi:ATP-dependent Clp protease protease subunit